MKGLPGRNRAAELGRDPGEIEIAPQFSVTVGKASEEAEARYMRSGLVAHRRSLAYTGRDLSRQVEAIWSARSRVRPGGLHSQPVPEPT